MSKEPDVSAAPTSDDNTEPKTFRSQSCYDALITSFSGPILDNAQPFSDKAAARAAADPANSWDG